MRRPIAVVTVLFITTTILGFLSFRWYYRDFFYLRRVYRAPQPQDRKHLLAILEKGYHNRPGNVAMSLMLGEALMRVGETRRSVEVIRRQVKRYPDSVGILWAYANALAADGQAEEADRVFRDLMTRLSGRSDAPSASGAALKEVRP